MQKPPYFEPQYFYWDRKLHQTNSIWGFTVSSLFPLRKWEGMLKSSAAIHQLVRSMMKVFSDCYPISVSIRSVSQPVKWWRPHQKLGDKTIYIEIQSPFVVCSFQKVQEQEDEHFTGPLLRKLDFERNREHLVLNHINFHINSFYPLRNNATLFSPVKQSFPFFCVSVVISHISDLWPQLQPWIFSPRFIWIQN